MEGGDGEGLELSQEAVDVDVGIKPKRLKSPTEPTALEIEEHEMTGHACHRSWCGHCMRARGLMERHTQQKEESEGLPVLAMDYFFFFSKDEQGLPHLQVRDSHTNMCWSSAVPAKGADPFAVNFVLNILDEVGYRKLVMKSDNERSIKSLKSAVKAASKMDIVLEESKTGDSQANGLAEVSVRETKGQCRAMKSALQEKLGMEVPDAHPVLTWLARHANFLMSRFRINGHDGKTGYERLKGRKWRRPVVMFGERIWFRPLKSYTAGAGGLENKLMSGRYIGTHGRNGDIMAMTSEGVIKGSSVKRMTQQERWDPSDMEKLRGTPWNLRPRMAGDVDSLPIPIELPKAEEGEKLLPEPAQRDSAPEESVCEKEGC